MQAAIVSGVPAKTYLILSYVICSILAVGVGARTHRTDRIRPSRHQRPLTLESIAAAVIAGVSIKGGVGRVEMVALGAHPSAYADRCHGSAADRPAHSGYLPRHYCRSRRSPRRAFATEGGACLKQASPERA